MYVSQLLFPTPPRPAQAGRDSAASATAAAAVARDTVVADSARLAGASGAIPAPAAPGADSVPAAARADTATVTTAQATYRVSSLGAAPISAELHEFPRLARQGFRVLRRGRVEMVRPGEPMLRYRVVMPGRTVSFERTVFTVEGSSGGDSLTYRATESGVSATITYAFTDGYLARVRGRVEGATSPAYLLVELPSGLQTQEADTLDDLRQLAYSSKRRNGDAKRIHFAQLDSGERRVQEGPLDWVAAKSKYFVVGLVPAEGGGFGELTIQAGAKNAEGMMTHARGTTVMPLGEGNFAFDLYVGPLQWRRLLAVGRGFDEVNAVGSWMGGVAEVFTTPVMALLLWMKDRLQWSYGWILVAFGIAVRILVWPLQQSALRSQLKMQRLQPELQEVQKKHAKDPEKLRTEMVKVYQKHGMNPLSPILGCLPMLLPLPFFLALFFVFQNTIEFRGVPFMWLPDISVRDPFYVMPILTGITMFFVSYISMKAAPPNPQTKMLTYVMPIMMTVLFITFASGLHIYYTAQNIASLPQQWLIARERQKSTP